jgi:hypothetical protein
MKPRQLERAAQVLIEAAILASRGLTPSKADEEAAKKHGVSTRQIRRWRASLPNEPELSAHVRSKMTVVEQGWADEIPGALRASIAFLEKAAREADPKDPDAIHAVAGAMKLLSETAGYWKVLDARLARQARPADGSAGTPAPSGADGSDPAQRPRANVVN